MARHVGTVALTGATGFIGNRVTQSLKAHGISIRPLARGHDRSAGAADAIRFDLEDPFPPDPRRLVGCDAVVHLAARIPAHHADPREAERCMQANALGTLRLIESMKIAGVPVLVQTTSANAYAAWENHPDERASLFPASRAYYLGSKVAQEILAGEACRAAGIDMITLRISSVYGPGQAAGAVPTILRNVLAGEPVSLTNKGLFGADFVLVSDVVAALMLALVEGTTGAYNVGSGMRSTLRDIATCAAGIAEHDVPITFAPDTPTLDLGFPALDIARLRSLGYAPIDLPEGLLRTLAWMKAGECRPATPKG